MELALAEEADSRSADPQVLREATVHRQIQPVLCGSALHGIGVQPLLDAVAAYLPSPLDVPPVEGDDLKTKGKHKARRRRHRHEKSASPTPTSRSAAWCSRCCRQDTATCTGSASTPARSKANSRVLNPGKDKKENVAQLWRIQADRKKDEQVERAPGRRHRRRHRPARLDHRRHALRHPRADPARIDRVPRDGHLDGHRAGEHRPTARSWPRRSRCSSGRTPRSARAKTRRPARRSSAAWANCTSK